MQKTSAYLVRPLSLLLAFAGLLFVGQCRRLSPYARSLMTKGFPESYAVRLDALHARHPAWTFEPLPVDDLPWDEIVRRECTPAWNLVVYATWAPPEWNVYGVDNYRPYYAPNAKAYDSGSWYQASEAAIAYFMDPRNFLGDTEIFMFETIGFNPAVHTVPTIERTLDGSFMADAGFDGGTNRFSALLLDVGRRIGVSPVFLAGRLALEQGPGSVQASGRIGDSLVELHRSPSGRIGNQTVWGTTYARNGTNTAAIVAKGAGAYNGYYNFFNIRAFGSGVFEIRYNAWKEAAEVDARHFGPWTTQERAIRGGALKVKERYVDTHRHTRYLQKFSVDPAAGEFRWKQYMQNIASPLVEARRTALAYADAGTFDAPHRFIIPVYRDMPHAPCPDSAAGKSVYSPTK